MTIRRRSCVLLLSLLILHPMAAWVQYYGRSRISHLESSVEVAPPPTATTTRLLAAAFQVGSKKPSLRPRCQDNNNANNKIAVSDRIPYDWANDKLDESKEDVDALRPWALDNVVVEEGSRVIAPSFQRRPGNDYDYDQSEKGQFDWGDDLWDSLDGVDKTRQEEQKIRTKNRFMKKWNPFTKRNKKNDHAAPQPPLNSRARLSTTDAGTLIIDLPSSGMDSNAISSGVFGALWFSAIAPATFAGGFATAAILLPFWLAGCTIAKKAIVDPFCKSELTIGQYAWSLRTSYANAKMKQVEGSTLDLKGATVEDLHLEVNGKPFYEIKLHSSGDQGATGFGNGLELEELDYLAYTINKHLDKLRNMDGDCDTEQDGDSIRGFITGRTI